MLRLSFTTSSNIIRYTLTNNATLRRSFTVNAPVYSSAPVGVAAALQAAKENANAPVKPQLFNGFSLAGRVGVVSGGNRGIGLEMALALAEAGAKVYALDLPTSPGEDFLSVQKYVERFGTGAKLNYVAGGVDVTNQKSVWDAVAEIGGKEGRMDVGVAAAGILKGYPALEHPADELQKVMNVNVNGVLYTAQAVGQQMQRYRLPGSIILIASMSGSITNKDQAWVAYNTSKSAVLQMTRSLACELGPQAIRVNAISPGVILTKMTGDFLEKHPELFEIWSAQNPLGRFATPDELRGVLAWLASDMSTFCTGSDIRVDGGQCAW